MTAEIYEERFYYLGKPLEDMSKEELIEAVKWLGNAYNETTAAWAAEAAELGDKILRMKG